MSKPLLPLEVAVLDLLLSRADEGYAALRAQLASVEVAAREMSGAGFFTTLRVGPDSPEAPASVGNPVGQGATYDEDVYAEVDGMAWPTELAFCCGSPAVG